MLRYFASLLLAGSLVHLNVARADVACAAHDHHAPPAPAAPSHHGGGHHHDGGTAPSDGKDCKTPAQQDCCQALTSCSVALGFGDSQDVTVVDANARAVFAAVAELVSCDAAPEPPPPKV